MLSSSPSGRSAPPCPSLRPFSAPRQSTPHPTLHAQRAARCLCVRVAPQPILPRGHTVHDPGLEAARKAGLAARELRLVGVQPRGARDADGQAGHVCVCPCGMGGGGTEGLLNRGDSFVRANRTIEGPTGDGAKRRQVQMSNSTPPGQAPSTAISVFCCRVTSTTSASGRSHLHQAGSMCLGPQARCSLALACSPLRGRPPHRSCMRSSRTRPRPK